MAYGDKNYIRREQRPISVKWKMFAILICFVTVFVVFVWVFEIRLLNFFYQTARFNELEDTAAEITELFDHGVLTSENITQKAEELHNDIWIYQASEGSIDVNRPLYHASGTREPFITFIEDEFDNLYQSTLFNGGSYIAIVPMKNYKESYFDFKIIEDNYEEPNKYPYVSPTANQNLTTLYLNVYNNGENEILIIQRSHLEPLGATIQTLKNQFLFIGTFLIIAAFVLAICMAKFITKPIVQINDSAKCLAKGRYDAEFIGHGYREIEELSNTLNYAARELSKNDELQKELIANVSHDLRTPLTMIKGYGEVMRDIPGENTAENIQVIIDEATRLSDLVNDMFDISKIQSGTRKPEMRPFCLTETVRATIARYDKLTKQDGYKIEFIADSDIYVCADSTMILQVIYNLINNAINYSGDDKLVVVKQTAAGKKVRISITDNGEGISEADIPLIWDRYYKVDKVHRRATVGTGLGLSIVKGILELHNATYGVTSAPTKGSTFWFELDIADADEIKAELVEY